MLGLFETILNLSLIGSIVILLIVLVRRLLRRIPTKYIYGLWALAAFRLLCPKSPSSVLSLFNYLPKKKISVVPSQGATVHASGVTTPTSAARALVQSTQKITQPSSLQSAFVAEKAGSNAPDIWQILMILWMLGMCVLAIAILYKTITIYRSVRNTRKIGENVYSGSSISSPFVLGVLKPRIFMPQGLSEKEFSYLLNHERMHLRRKDMVFKFFWITVLIVHWFNPLVWIAYWLFENDMEMSCDEEVIKNLGTDLRADYCMSLVSFARKSSAPKYLVSTLSFGKENVKARIKNVMKYKKLSLWLSVVSIIAVSSVFICGFLSPVDKRISAQENETVSETYDAKANEETTASCVETVPETTVSEETVADENTSEASQSSIEVPPKDMEAYESYLEGLENNSEPLWGSDEWFAQHSYNVPADYPEVSMPDGKLFDLDLPRPDSEVLFETQVKKGTAFSSDTLGDFTKSYVVVGETNPSDLSFIATSQLSESELASYIQLLRNYGFIDVAEGAQTYIGYTEDGCYVIISSYGDIEKFTTIRFSSSTSVENDTMGVG